jgi:sugar lactone lactonase YvrE
MLRRDGRMRGGNPIRSTTYSLKAILVLLFLTVLTISEAADKKQKKGPPPMPKPGELVWPGPPEQPRVNWQAMITGEGDFKEQKKASLADRMMGEKKDTGKKSLRRPYGIAVGKDGRIFVADSSQQAIIIFDPRDKSVTSWKGNAQFGLSLPIGLAIDGDSRLFVSDSKGAQVVMFSPEGKPEASLGAKLMKRPVGLAVDAQRGRLYVGDLELRKILVYDLKTLKLLKQIGGSTAPQASDPDTLSAPANMAVDRDGRLFVADTLQCRVIVFNSEGKFIRSFGKAGDRPGEFARPKGIALDSEGHVYVVDAAFGNIQVFNPDGQLLLYVGSGGEAPGELSLPTGLTIDSQNRIYVAEHWMLSKGRLQIFQYLTPGGAKPPVAGQSQEIR